MRTIQESDTGLGDLKALTYVRPEATVAPRSVIDRSQRRKIVGIMVAVLLFAGAQYVALKIIYATQPVHVAGGK
ncbi:hypothetical protein [Burkholderia metallica]|uniref:hypothetical protein n=1 Tax=Burkholderia metallica TaxID=488729 RepID=UPI001CF21C01|nr:hypothetical protein [Burkholderia metallica]MCA8023614.1 hypothetical protein [Burkholderia metallica]